MSRACPDLWEPRVGNSPGPPGLFFKQIYYKFKRILNVWTTRVIAGIDAARVNPVVV